MNPRITALTLACVLGTSSSALALTIAPGTPPTIQVNPDNPALLFPGFEEDFEEKMNDELADAFNNTLDTARKNLAGFEEQKDLAQAFGNANAYSMNSATLQGFQNYSLFAVAAGLMLGVQAPSTNLSYYNDIVDDIREKGDLYAGLGVGVTFLNLGLNAEFLLPGLYFNAKYGAMTYDFDDFAMDFSVMGVGANYRLLDTKSLVGLIKWRGVSIGTGFYMQSSKVNLGIVSDTIRTQAHMREAVLSGSSPSDSVSKGAMMDQMGYTEDNPDADLTLVPSFGMGLDITTVTVPIDAVTAVSLFWGVVNLTLGAGVDLNFGSSEVVLRGDSEVDISSDPDKVTFTPAEVAIDGSSDNGPSMVRFRVMTGVGVGLGPVKIDVPLIFYPASGFAAGLTVAVVW